MNILGYCPPWLRRVADQVDAGRPCPRCGGYLYGQPGSNGRLYKCDGCHILSSAGSLYSQFSEQERAARLQEVERQRVEWMRNTTPEERRAQAERDIEELF